MLAEKVDYRPFRFPEENLEALADADNSIDHLITADVFEHVRLDALAFREVYRVLKAGGYFFLQVPTVTTCCRLAGLGFSVGYVCQGLRRWGVPPMDMIVCRKNAPLEYDRSDLDPSLEAGRDFVVPSPTWSGFLATCSRR